MDLGSFSDIVLNVKLLHEVSHHVVLRTDLSVPMRLYHSQGFPHPIVQKNCQLHPNLEEETEELFPVQARLILALLTVVLLK